MCNSIVYMRVASKCLAKWQQKSDWTDEGRDEAEDAAQAGKRIEYIKQSQGGMCSFGWNFSGLGELLLLPVNLSVLLNTATPLDCSSHSWSWSSRLSVSVAVAFRELCRCRVLNVWVVLEDAFHSYPVKNSHLRPRFGRSPKKNINKKK